MEAWEFTAGEHLPKEPDRIVDQPEWKAFAQWFKAYMGFEPTVEDVEMFECFYAGIIYESECAVKCL